VSLRRDSRNKRAVSQGGQEAGGMGKSIQRRNVAGQRSQFLKSTSKWEGVFARATYCRSKVRSKARTENRVYV